MIWIFAFGCFVTAIVATACGLILAGIRAERRELEALGERRAEPGSGAEPPAPAAG
ncbi:MAG: hypothetical protein U0R71_17500 [Solirubrobacterales bacterium]